MTKLRVSENSLRIVFSLSRHQIFTNDTTGTDADQDERSVARESLFRLRPKRRNLALIRGQVSAFNQVDAIGYRWHHGVHTVADCARLYRQIDEQRRTEDARCLPRSSAAFSYGHITIFRIPACDGMVTSWEHADPARRHLRHDHRHTRQASMHAGKTQRLRHGITAEPIKRCRH